MNIDRRFYLNFENVGTRISTMSRIRNLPFKDGRSALLVALVSLSTPSFLFNYLQNTIQQKQS